MSRPEVDPIARTRDSAALTLSRRPATSSRNSVAIDSRTRPRAAARRAAALIALVRSAASATICAPMLFDCAHGLRAMLSAASRPTRKSSPDGVKPGPSPSIALACLHAASVLPRHNASPSARARASMTGAVANASGTGGGQCLSHAVSCAASRIRTAARLSRSRESSAGYAGSRACHAHAASNATAIASPMHSVWSVASAGAPTRTPLAANPAASRRSVSGASSRSRLARATRRSPGPARFTTRANTLCTSPRNPRSRRARSSDASPDRARSLNIRAAPSPCARPSTCSPSRPARSRCR